MTLDELKEELILLESQAAMYLKLGDIHSAKSINSYDRSRRLVAAAFKTKQEIANLTKEPS